MNALYLTNGTYIDPSSSVFSTGTIKVESGDGGGIKFIDSIPENAKILNCSGKYITKSFVNSHHHIYSALATGMPSPKKLPSNFYEILKFVWWKLDKSLTKEMIEVSALSAAIESIRSGVTFIVDHHSSPMTVNGSLRTIEKALTSAGISSALSYELSDRDGTTIRDQALQESREFLVDGFQSLVGLHASFTVSEDLLKRAIDLASEFGTGIHIHAAEEEIDQKLTVEKYGLRVIERLGRSGTLSLKGSILAHCIHINDQERDLLKSSEAWIVQNPESNLNNGVGIYNPDNIEDKSLLGTDGMNGDMIGSSRIAYMTGKLLGGDSPKDIYKRLRNGHRYLKNNGFSGDGDNNLVILDYNPATRFDNNNFCSHFIYGITRYCVDSVISNGELVMKEKNILKIDESSILLHSKELSARLWEKMEEI